MASFSTKSAYCVEKLDFSAAVCDCRQIDLIDRVRIDDRKQGKGLRTHEFRQKVISGSFSTQ
jgi:hypothetical protein